MVMMAVVDVVVVEVDPLVVFALNPFGTSGGRRLGGCGLYGP